MGISTYALAVVGALTAAGCLALAIGLTLNRSGRPLRHSGHIPGGRVLSPTASSGLRSEHYASSTSRADRVETRRRGRPLTADQQATRDAWARWRAEQGS